MCSVQCAPVVSVLLIKLICPSYNVHWSSVCYGSNGLVFYICNKAIEIVDKWPHLGHNNCDDEFDITSRKFNLIGQFNNIICNFMNVSCFTKLKQFKAYCTSLYGCEIWDLSHPYIEGRLHLGIRTLHISATIQLSLCTSSMFM